MKFARSALLLGIALSAAAAAPQPALAVDQPSVSSPSARPPEERIALARRFVALAMPEQDALEQMRDLSMQLISVDRDEETSASDREYAKQFMDRLIVKGAPIIRMHMMSIREVTALIYAEEFSAPELQDMIAFAQTPAGKHYLAREQVVDLNQQIVAQEMLLREALEPVMFDVRKELCQEATAKRIAAGDKKAKCPLSSEPDAQQG
jgi:hypothetical protein